MDVVYEKNFIILCAFKYEIILVRKKDNLKKVLKLFCVAVFAVGLISGATFAEGLTNANITGINNSGSFANTANGMQVDINKTGTTDINWGKLNVNSGEVLDFNFNAANATAFNKVNALGGASILSGAINAIGTHAGTSSIIISNPAGVLFKDGAVINANVFNVDAGLNGAIDVNNLLIKKGNLSLTTKNGNISLNGLKYDNLGNLTINTVDGTISLANILGANKIEAYATSDGNILLGNAIPTTIGG